jgi:hypothetical protein
MGVLDALSDAQADGLAAGLASLSSLVSLSVGARQDVPLTRPAAVASRLSQLLHGLTKLEDLSLDGFERLADQPPVRVPTPPRLPPPSTALPPLASGC